MSDHEGYGLDLDRWEEASLPGGSVFSSGAPDAFAQGNLTTSANYRQPQRPTGPHSQEHAPFQPRPFQHVHQRQPQPAVARPAYLETAAYLRFKNGAQADGVHQFGLPWKLICGTGPRSQRARVDSTAWQQIEEICVRTHTYMTKPADNENEIRIWGTPEQVAEAQAALADLERTIRPGVGAVNSAVPPSWVKFHAVDGRAEHRLERQSRMEKSVAARQEKADNIDYLIEGALLWPKDVDMDAFATDNTNVIDDMRKTQICRISFQKDPVPLIGISAMEEVVFRKIHMRMINLIKEMVSRRNELIKLNLVHVPDFTIYRDRVGLQDKDSHTDTYLPTLHGRAKSSEEADKHYKTRRSAHLENRKQLKRAMDECIKSMRLSDKYVRLRVAFGEIGFTQFMKPAHGEDSYSFDEFVTMVTKGRTKLRLNGVQVRNGDISQLPDIISSIGAFRNCRTTYGAQFEFPSASASMTLKLETVFRITGDKSDDFEIQEQRWLEVGGPNTRLEINLLNFERPDYQVAINAFSFHENKLIRNDMINFQHNVGFERPPNGIKSAPHLRVKYPPGQRGLRTVADIYSIKWNFKDTDGVFELRRKDVWGRSSRKRISGWLVVVSMARVLLLSGMGQPTGSVRLVEAWRRRQVGQVSRHVLSGKSRRGRSCSSQWIQGVHYRSGRDPRLVGRGNQKG